MIAPRTCPAPLLRRHRWRSVTNERIASDGGWNPRVSRSGRISQSPTRVRSGGRPSRPARGGCRARRRPRGGLRTQRPRCGRWRRRWCRGPEFTGDPCLLITAAEIQSVLCSAPDGSTTTMAGPGRDAHCEWTNEGDLTGPAFDFGWGMQLDVKSPGGKQDFLETRQFMGLLKNPLNSLV